MFENKHCHKLDSRFISREMSTSGSYCAYSHQISGRKLFAKFRSIDPPMRPRSNGGERIYHEQWKSDTIYWDWIDGLKVSRFDLDKARWSGIDVNDNLNSEQIAHPLQFFMRYNEAKKFSEVNQKGQIIHGQQQLPVEDIPIVFAFVYGKRYIVSTKKWESLGEFGDQLDAKKIENFMAKNIDYIVYWRQEDANFFNDLRVDIPMINFSLLSHLLLGGFQNLLSKSNCFGKRLEILEKKRELDWRNSKLEDKLKPIPFSREENGDVYVGDLSNDQVRCSILEAFFYDNYADIIALSDLTMANLNELADSNIGEKMLQTMFPVFSLPIRYNTAYRNGPQFGPLSVVKIAGINMFTLASVFLANCRREVKCQEVTSRFGRFPNHYILASAIVNTKGGFVGAGEFIANGIFFSKNPFTDLYKTFNDMRCDGIVIGRSTFLALDSEYNVLMRDVNLPEYVAVFMTLNYVFSDSSTKGFAHNATLSMFEEITMEELKIEEFCMDS